MIERCVWTNAKLLIEKCGDKVSKVAARRVEELSMRDDFEGAAVWRRIIFSIEVAQNMEPDGSVH